MVSEGLKPWWFRNGFRVVSESGSEGFRGSGIDAGFRVVSKCLIPSVVSEWFARGFIPVGGFREVSEWFQSPRRFQRGFTRVSDLRRFQKGVFFLYGSEARAPPPHPNPHPIPIRVLSL